MIPWAARHTWEAAAQVLGVMREVVELLICTF